MNDTERFMARLRVYDESKQDIAESRRAVEYREDGFYFRGKPITVNNTALQQLCRLLDIPQEFFFNTMIPDERATVFNRLNRHIDDEEKLFRFSGDLLYGVVSRRYRKLDNIMIADILGTARDSGLGLKPVKFCFDPDHSRFVFVDETAEVSEIAPAITITNSENGLGSLKISAGTFRWVCTNGLMMPIGDVSQSRWMHKGNSDVYLPDLFTVLNQSRRHVEQMDTSRGKYLTTSAKMDIILDLAEKLGRCVAERVIEAANREYNGGRTVFDTINAVTRAAQAFRPAEQTEIESYAAGLLAA